VIFFLEYNLIKHVIENTLKKDFQQNKFHFMKSKNWRDFLGQSQLNSLKKMGIYINLLMWNFLSFCFGLNEEVVVVMHWTFQLHFISLKRAKTLLLDIMSGYGMGPGWVAIPNPKCKPIYSLLRPESPSTRQGIINKDFLDGMKPNPRTLCLGVSFWVFFFHLFLFQQSVLIPASSLPLLLT
jgi:hypothetical protein